MSPWVCTVKDYWYNTEQKHVNMEIYSLNRQFLMVEIKTIQFLETSSVLYLFGCFKGVQ